MKLILLLMSLLTAVATAQAAPESLFDGKTLNGWGGDTTKTWRVVDGAIVGGSVAETVPHNEFLATTGTYTDFDLRLKFRLVGNEGFVNAGIQFRSTRIPDHFEMIGYQADLGDGFYGSLYDESRRNKLLATADKAALSAVPRIGEWNEYRIRCEGRRIQLWINGVQTVDYTEPDAAIPQSGKIALQIHGGGKAEVSYREIVLEQF